MTEPQKVAGVIYTNETSVTRALAAEFRAARETTTAMLSKLFGVDLAPLSRVEAEVGEDTRVDVLLTFGDRTVAVEGKLGHEVSQDQVDREAGAADFLVLVLKDRKDLGAVILPERSAVVTWSELLGRFQASRLTVADVEGATDRHREVRSEFYEFAQQGRALNEVLGEGWTVDLASRSNSGFPSIDVYGPRYSDDRCIIIQIEAPRGGTPSTVTATIGTSIIVSADGGVDDLDPDTPTAPPWVTRAQILGEFWDRCLKGTGFAVSQNKAPRMKDQVPLPKAQIAEKFDLPLEWAKGYADSYIGVKTERMPIERLGEFLQLLGRLLPELHQTFLEAEEAPCRDA